MRSLILHNDNIRLPTGIEHVHVVHIEASLTGPELKQQAIEKYHLQQLADDRIILYASPLGCFRTRIDTLSSIPDSVMDVYVRVTSLIQASSPP